MATNIIEALREKAGYPSLQKVDPNIQETNTNAVDTEAEKFAQAAIPAVLAGLFNFTRTDTGCNYILLGGGPKPWLDTIFENKKSEAVEKIAHYSGIDTQKAGSEMEEIAADAVAIIHEASGEKATAEKMKAYMSGERHNILTHLPAALQLGDLLNDTTMDDRTNKMEGPLSNLMHSIENKFSGGGS